MNHSNRSCAAPRRGWAHRAAAGAALAVGLASVPAWAVQLGQVDTFSNGSFDDWGVGPASPVPPVVVAGGGPGGAADSFLRLSATGLPGAGGKLVGIAGAQWAGNYLAAGVTGLSMWLLNPGATDLSLRLWLQSPAGNSVTSTPVLLPAGSGWTAARFSLLPGALTTQGAVGANLGDVTELRLFHGIAASFPGGNIAGQLGVDNITAVPEPAAAVLMLAGLAGLLAHARQRSRCTTNTHRSNQT